MSETIINYVTDAISDQIDDTPVTDADMREAIIRAAREYRDCLTAPEDRCMAARQSLFRAIQEYDDFIS